MADSNKNRGRWFWNIAKVVGVLILCTVISFYIWAGISITRSLHRADIFELTGILRAWVKAGQPEGEALMEFLRGCREDIIVSNRLFTIEGINHVTQFAVTRPKSRRSGTLFITTNEVLIWLAPNGQSKLVPRY